MAKRPEWKIGWERIRESVLMRDGYMCQACRTKRMVTLATEVDHVIPRYKGGTQDLSNLRAICAPCHEEKSKREANEGYRPKVGVDADGYPQA